MSRMRAGLYRTIADRVHGGLLLAALALVAYGTLMVWSATATMDAHDAMVRRHLLGLAVGVLPIAFLWMIDYMKLKGWTGPLLALLALLIISPRIPGLGDTAKGAQSWLQIAGVRLFQPSEPAKLIFIVCLAAVIAEFGGRLEERRDVLRVAAVAMVPVGLILLQPDLGTGLVFVATAAGMLLVGGLKPKWFLIGAGVALLAAVLAISTPILQDYQKNRLLVFVDPARDPKGAGYNLAQSKIAVGSGGLTGRGLNLGGTAAAATQSNLNFIPERHTDFIFSVLGEQLGFVGAVLLLGLYLALLAAALSISASSRDLFGALIAAGILSMWLFQILENVGMTIGVMPVTGIPLPFMSFGSSAMVTNMAAVGMLLSIWSRRYGTTTTTAKGDSPWR